MTGIVTAFFMGAFFFAGVAFGCAICIVAKLINDKRNDFQD